jgi:hypothetical protein
LTIHHMLTSFSLSFLFKDKTGTAVVAHLKGQLEVVASCSTHQFLCCSCSLAFPLWQLCCFPLECIFDIFLTLYLLLSSYPPISYLLSPLLFPISPLPYLSSYISSITPSTSPLSGYLRSRVSPLSLSLHLRSRFISALASSPLSPYLRSRFISALALSPLSLYLRSRFISALALSPLSLYLRTRVIFALALSFLIFRKIYLTVLSQKSAVKVVVKK